MFKGAMILTWVDRLGKSSR